VKHYIANQEAHHRKMSFQDEVLRELLRRHQQEWDESIFGTNQLIGKHQPQPRWG